MAIAQNFPKIRPTLNLSFALTKALDPRITYARASAATYYGTDTAKAEENLILQSQTMTTSPWVVVNSSTTGSKTAPNGTSTAIGISATSTNGRTQQLVTIVSGLTHTLSMFVRRVTGVGDVRLIIADSSGTPLFTTTMSLTADWQRFTVSGAPAVTSISCRVIIDTSGDEVEIWGAQLEQRDSATNYTPTTNQRITNFVPVLESAAAGEARFDHNPVTGESLGLLIEESRTNLMLRSEEFDNAAYTKTRSSITADSIVAPSGELTGDKLVENTDTNTHDISVTASLTSGAAFTISLYAKSAGRNLRIFFPSSAFTTAFSVVFDLTAGTVTPAVTNSVGSITSVGNGWFRCVMTQTATATTTGAFTLRLIEGSSTTSYTGDGFSGIFIWGAQLEAGAFPTSYIPTTTAQVTRAADAASMTGANFSSWYSGGAGTVYSESAVYAANIKTQCVWDLGGGVTSTSLRSPQGTVNRLRATVGGTFSGGNTGAVISNNTFIKATVAWQGLGGRLQSGATGEDVTGAANLDATQLIVGGLIAAGSTALNGHIKKLAFYPAKIANDQLQGLTT